MSIACTSIVENACSLAALSSNLVVLTDGRTYIAANVLNKEFRP